MSDTEKSHQEPEQAPPQPATHSTIDKPVFPRHRELAALIASLREKSTWQQTQLMPPSTPWETPGPLEAPRLALRQIANHTATPLQGYTAAATIRRTIPPGITIVDMDQPPGQGRHPSSQENITEPFLQALLADMVNQGTNYQVAFHTNNPDLRRRISQAAAPTGHPACFHAGSHAT